jgi:hypothetical protein
VTTFYVDVSHHDWDRKGGNLDWPKVLAATSKCVMARATYGDPLGTHYTTRHFADFINGARAAGATLLGGFHNLVKGDQASINRQVDWLRTELDRLDCNWAMVDIERYTELINNDMWPRWDDVRQFCDRWRAVDWRMLTVYLPGWLWSNYLGKPDLTVLGWPLIESDYGANTAASPATVYTTRGGDTGRGWNATDGVEPSIWQFGSNLVVPGASSKTDVNAFRGSFAELDKLLLHLSDQTPEEPFMAALTDAQQAELYNWAKNVYAGMFKGGPSCGTGVPDAHRASADDSDLGNALFSKLNYVQKLLEGLVTAPGVGLSATDLANIREAVRVELDATHLTG